MRVVLMILLFAPFSSQPIEVVVYPYQGLDYDNINAYHYDIDEPDLSDFAWEDYGCACPY